MATLSKKSPAGRRLEDSMWNPDNQRHLPEEGFISNHEESLIAKWHRKELKVVNGKVVCRR